MPKKELAPEAQRYELYPGISGLPSFRGVNSEKHPGQLSAIQFRKLTDVRVVEDGIAVRPGERDVTGANPFNSGTTCIRNLHQFHCDPLKLWITTFGCPGGGGLTGGAMAHFDPEQDPQLQYFAFYKSSVNRDAVCGTYSGELYLGDGSNLKKVTLARPMYGVTAESIEKSPPDVLIKSFPGYTITALGEKFGLLFIGMVNLSSPTNSKIVVYDGVSMEDDKTGIRPPTMIYGGWRSLLAVGFQAAENMIRVRDSSGTWTDVAPGAGTVACAGPLAMVSAFDDLFIADGVQTVWKYNGTTLTAARVVAAAGVPASPAVPGMATVEFFSNRLVFGYVLATGAGSKFGTFDNTGSAIEWIDEVKDPTAQFSNLKYVYGLKAYRNLLYAVFYAADPVNSLIASPDYDVTGTWAGTNPSIASTAFRPFSLVVY